MAWLFLALGVQESVLRRLGKGGAVLTRPTFFLSSTGKGEAFSGHRHWQGGGVV